MDSTISCTPCNEKTHVVGDKGQAMAEIGARIQHYRLQRGWTQTELAQRLGERWTHQQVSFMELGRQRVPIDLVPRLCEVFEITPNILFGMAGETLEREMVDWEWQRAGTYLTPEGKAALIRFIMTEYVMGRARPVNDDAPQG